MKELKKWRLACPPSELDLVFPGEDGNPIERTYLLKEKFYPALTAAEVKHIRFHDLRHTFASLLLSNGENVKYVQKQMGHASPTVTLNIYAHLMERVNQEAAKRLENAVFRSTGSKIVAGAGPSKVKSPRIQGVTP
jgi:integrase